METTFLLYSVKYGFMLSFLYDCLRIFRMLITHKQVWVSLEDFGFWIYTALRVFWMMQDAYNGSIRWFSIFGGLAGVMLYCKLVSPFLLHWVGRIQYKCSRRWQRLRQRIGSLGIISGMKKKLTHLKKVLKIKSTESDVCPPS